jgi:thiamine pyrophosphate-dependent acetolactate synthase large subunit-like protein
MAFFRLIGEYGGRDSVSAVKEHHNALRDAFDALERRKYSKDIDEMRLVLCIGGELRDFELPGGVGQHRIFKKDRFAYAEIVLHPAEWKKGKRSIKAFLVKNYRQAVVDLCARLEKAELDIQTERLLADVEEVLAGFKAG